MAKPQHHTGRAGALALLAAGLAILSVSNGRFLIPLAVWIGPGLTLAGLRRLPPRTALLAGLAGFAVVFNIQSLGVLNMAPPLSTAIAAAIGAVGFIPYALDRLLAPRLDGVWSTLVFPLALGAVEFATASLSPYGTFGALAYAQPDNLPLLQLSSVTGLWGVSVLIAWFASAANHAFDHRRTLAADWRPCAIFAAVLLAVLAAGEARLALTPRGQTVRVAGLSPSTADGFHFLDSLGLDCSGGRCDAARTRTRLIQDELLAASRRQAQAGARAVLWSENAGVAFKDDEAGFIARGQALARQEAVTLVMALQVITPGRPLAENKAVTITPAGDIAAVYEKARPVPGDPDLAGKGPIPAMPTPLGRLSTAICFDLDFPDLIRQVGRSRADVLFVPASDWREIDPLHARMATFRGVENGVTVVRQTRRGLSLAADPLGRPIAEMDFFSTRDRVLVADIPTRRVPAPYPWIGDLFAWLGLLGLIGLTALALRRPSPDPGSAGSR